MKPYYQEDGVTIYHGDCRAVLPGLSFDLLVMDPPYGIGWTVPAYNGGRLHEGIQNDGDTTGRDWVLRGWPEIPAIVFGSPMSPLPKGVKQVMVWCKPPDAGIFGSVGGWRRDWEAIYLLGHWPVMPASRTSVIRTLGGTRTYLHGDHPHAKPVELLMKLIDNCPQGIVCDPFAGVGTTLVASAKLHRRAIGIEIEERYCEIAAERLRQRVLDF